MHACIALQVELYDDVQSLQWDSNHETSTLVVRIHRYDGVSWLCCDATNKIGGGTHALHHKAAAPNEPAPA
jgi:hypothetical protein